MARFGTIWLDRAAVEDGFTRDAEGVVPGPQFLVLGARFWGTSGAVAGASPWPAFPDRSAERRRLRVIWPARDMAGKGTGEKDRERDIF